MPKNKSHRATAKRFRHHPERQGAASQGHGEPHAHQEVGIARRRVEGMAEVGSKADAKTVKRLLGE